MRTSFYLEPPNLKVVDRVISERAWLLNKINQVKATKLVRKPSAINEIRDLEYRVRRGELEEAYLGSEWTKYEKYAIWELLTG